jgi:TRAP-type C4-dicarboxylate transport system substrate-binding protein
MKHIFSIAFLAAFLAHSSAIAAQHNLRIATIAPRDSAFDEALKRMGQTWKSVSGGAVSMIVHSGGTQGGEGQMVQRMRIKQLQGALLTGVGLSEIEPTVAGLQTMPMMFRTLDELDHVSAKLRPEIEQRLRDKGFIVLFWTDTGWIRFFSKEKVVTPDDLRKQKLFAWSGHPRQVQIYRRSGFTAVPLETSDINTSLASGLITAIPMPPLAANLGQIYRSAPHMLDLDWAPLIGAFVITLDAWNKIPAELQETMRRSSAKTGQELTQAGRKQNEDAVTAMKANGSLKVQSITPEIEELWRRAAETAYPEIRGTMVPADVFDRVVQILKEYRADKAAE